MHGLHLWVQMIRIFLKVIEKYPDFKGMYQQVYEICQNIEEVMGMFSERISRNGSEHGTVND